MIVTDREYYDMALVIPSWKTLEEVHTILSQLRSEPLEMHLMDFELNDTGLSFTGQYGSTKQRWIAHNVKKVDGVEIDWDKMAEWE